MNEYQKLQSQAVAIVKQAIKRGELVRPSTCELCGNEPGPQDKPRRYNYGHRNNMTNGRIIAHHWNGYEGDGALDVWFICSRCNSLLRGKRYHCGKVSKEEARVIVIEGQRINDLHKYYPPPGQDEL